VTQHLHSEICCGDCLEILPRLPQARMVFADPPDNLGMPYADYRDRRDDYVPWLLRVVKVCLDKAPILWLSYYYRYTPGLLGSLYASLDLDDYELRLFVWRFTFGQHRSSDCGNGYRPILRFATRQVTWNTGPIRVESARQRNGDKRADPRGRVPDDVWEFPRVCGNYRERRLWIPCQHPEALVERMIRMSCSQGDVVIDPFSGSGVTHRVAQRCGVHCYGTDISRFYCGQIAQETGAVLAEAAGEDATVQQQ
jgi:DNA modification methylase